jgi:hypothetical protein
MRFDQFGGWRAVTAVNVILDHARIGADREAEPLGGIPHVVRMATQDRPEPLSTIFGCDGGLHF